MKLLLKIVFVVLAITFVIDKNVTYLNERQEKKLTALKGGWVHFDRGQGEWVNYKTGEKAMADWDFRIDKDGNRY